MSETRTTYLCPAGWLWVCPAKHTDGPCGRTSRDKVGKYAIHQGWGAECFDACRAVEEKYLIYHEPGKHGREPPRVKRVKKEAQMLERLP